MASANASASIASSHTASATGSRPSRATTSSDPVTTVPVRAVYRRPIDAAEAYVSRHPIWPHAQRSPSGYTGM